MASTRNSAMGQSHWPQRQISVKPSRTNAEVLVEVPEVRYLLQTQSAVGGIVDRGRSNAANAVELASAPPTAKAAQAPATEVGVMNSRNLVGDTFRYSTSQDCWVTSTPGSVRGRNSEASASMS
jgi:hypothetical protein